MVDRPARPGHNTGLESTAGLSPSPLLPLSRGRKDSRTNPRHPFGGLPPDGSSRLRSTQRMHLRTRPTPAVRGIIVLLAVQLFAGAASAGGSTDAEAQKLLKSAQDAYAKKDFPLATHRFRDVVARFAKTPSAPA